MNTLIIFQYTKDFQSKNGSLKFVVTFSFYDRIHDLQLRIWAKPVFTLPKAMGPPLDLFGKQKRKLKFCSYVFNLQPYSRFMFENMDDARSTMPKSVKPPLIVFFLEK